MRVLLLLTGSQAGKTTFLPALLYWEWLHRGPGDYLAASSTFPVFDTKFLPVLRDYFCRKLGWGVYKAGRGGAGVIEGRDGSRILCRMGTDPDALESGTFKGGILDEWGQDKVPLESYQAVQRRLAKEQGRCAIGTTPYNMGWLRLSVHDRAMGGDPLYREVNFRSIDNPAYPPEEYHRLKAEWPEWRSAMFLDGIFTRPAGLIYSDYEDSYVQFGPERGNHLGGGHLVKPFTIPATWLRGLGVDPGPVNCGRVWLAIEPNHLDADGVDVPERYYAYREKSVADKPGPQLAAEVREYEEPIIHAYGGAASEDERRREWVLGGLPLLKPLISDVEPGIDRVIGLLRAKRLFVFDTLTGLRSQLGTYSRELDDAGEPLEKIADKSTFHLLDALRYLCSAFVLESPTVPPPPLTRDQRTLTGAALFARTKRGRFV